MLLLFCAFISSEAEEIESIWIEIWPSRQHCKGILLTTIYRPPDTSKYLHKDFNAVFNSMVTKASGESKEMIVLGDMNVNFLVPEENKNLKSVLELLGLKQIIEKPTRITETSRTLIDVILTNTPANISCTDVIATGIGDHDMPGCVRKINNGRFNPRLITCRDYKTYNARNMNSELKKVDWTPFYSQRNVNEAWAKMKNILSDIFGRHAPKISKKVRGKPAPWLSNKVKVLMNHRDKLLRRSKRTRKESDISEYKRKRNEVNIAIKRAKSDYHKKLLKESAKDPNKFWKTLKSIYPTKKNDKQTMKTLDIDGAKIKDPHLIAEAFCSFFTGIVTTLKEKAFPLCNFRWKRPTKMSTRTDQKFIFKTVSRYEVKQQLKSIKRNKATGLDDLPPGLIKDSAELISAPLAHLINLSLKTGIFPTDWKTAKVIPTHKSGAHSNPDNYRPISVLPVISKVIEKVIHHQLIIFLDKNHLLTNFQFGFRPKLSTEYAATILLDSIRDNVDKGRLVGAIFVDLSKAFDTVSHAMLLDKLPIYGVQGKELEWFKDYLFFRKAKVSCNGCLSKENALLTGVPQGSILGPLLFLILFNDVVDVIEHSSILKYADDTVLYVADQDIQSINAKLSKDMDCLADWLKSNELVLNLKKGKTEALLFGTPQRIAKQAEPLEIKLSHETVIKNATEYKYLGVRVDSSLNLNSNFNTCYNKASGRLRLLAKIRSYLDQATAATIYNVMVLPAFTYCGILQLKYTNTQLSRLSSLHSRALKIVFRDGRPNKKLTSVVNANKTRACKLVRKCLDKETCEQLQNHFTLQEHERQTRNNTYTLKLPRIKTEYARKSFLFMGAKVYNELPLELRKIENYEEFEKQLKDYFN